MQIAEQIVVLVHLVGFAALLGGILVQTRSAEPEVNGTMVWGGWVSLASGAVLVVLGLVSSAPLDWGPLGVKLAVTSFLVLLLTRNRRYLSVPRGLWALLGVLTLLNAALSMPWQ
jgi:hypothetical protein